MLHETTMTSPVGPLRLIASDRGLRAVLWPDDDPARVHLGEQPELTTDHPILDDAISQLEEYFAGVRTEFDLPLDAVGTEFQQACWQVLSEIPYGSTISYGEQADLLGRPTAVRAVGGANGRNPLSVVVPCHRVVAAGGALAGFAGGIETKKWLLEHEAANKT